MLTQTMEKLTKPMSKLPQQLKETHEVSSKHQQVTYCELCNGDHPTGYYPLVNEKVNYMGNQNQYQ